MLVSFRRGAAMDAPAEVALLRDFANTVDVEDGSDALSSPSALGQWLREAGLLGRASRVEARHLRLAHDLRDGVRAALVAHHDGRDHPDTAMDGLAAQLPIRARFTAAGPALA